MHIGFQEKLRYVLKASIV